MLVLCLLVLPFIRTQSETTAETSNEFLDRFNVIAKGISEAVGVMSNCSSSIFEKFVKNDKDATFANLKSCVKEQMDFEKSFKEPLQNYQKKFQKLLEAEQAALNTMLDMFSNGTAKELEKVNATRTRLGEKASKIGEKLDHFGQNMMTNLKSFGVSLKESDFVQGMKNTMDEMKNRVTNMFDKIKNFFGW